MILAPAVVARSIRGAVVMVKGDEKQLYAELRKRFLSGPFSGMESLFRELDIPWNRGHFILEKWDSKGYIGSGVSVRCGWFSESSPEELT